MKKTLIVCLALVAGIALTLSVARAWHDDGHDRTSRAAVALLPADVPAWFRAGGDTIAHLSIDPDVGRHPRTPQLANAEHPEHYLDWELLEGAPLPPLRYEFIQLCAEKDLDPAKVGLLPYAITEWTQRLTLAFAEHRRWPDNAPLRSKCLVYAGILAHYSEDLCMPLHTTIHFNGRIGPGGRKTHTGIHARIDALPGKLVAVPADRLNALKPIQPFADVWTGTLREMAAAHALVDRTYELEAKIPELANTRIEDTEMLEFTSERTLASSRFTAQLFLTAWRQSADIELEPWLERPPVFPNDAK